MCRCGWSIASLGYHWGMKDANGKQSLEGKKREGKIRQNQAVQTGIMKYVCSNRDRAQPKERKRGSGSSRGSRRRKEFQPEKKKKKKEKESKRKTRTVCLNTIQTRTGADRRRWLL